MKENKLIMISIFEVNNHLKKHWAKYAVGGVAALAAAKGIDSAEEYHKNAAEKLGSELSNHKNFGNDLLDPNVKLGDAITKEQDRMNSVVDKISKHHQAAKDLHDINIYGKAKNIFTK